MKPDIEELRRKYMDNPPEGMTSMDIRRMSEDELLDMDYFLNEDNLFDDEAGVEGFYIVSKSVSFYLYARLCAGYSRSIIRQKSNFPIKEQKGKTALPFLARYNSTSSHSFFVI